MNQTHTQSITRTIFFTICLLQMCHGSRVLGEVRSERTIIHQYYEGLRERTLFQLAESSLYDELTRPEGLAEEREGILIAELVQTLAARSAYEETTEQESLWKRAEQAIEKFLADHPSSPERIFLTFWKGWLHLFQGEYLHWQVLISPHDQEMSARVQSELEQSIRVFQQLEQELANHTRNLKPEREDTSALSVPSSPLMKELQQRIQFEQSRALLTLCEITRDSQRRDVWLLKVERLLETFSRRDEIRIETVETWWQSRLMMLQAMRLKLSDQSSRESFQSFAQTLKKFENSQLPQAFQDGLIAERCRFDLIRQQPTEAVSRLATYRTNRRGLSGELEFVNLQCMMKLWEFTLAKNQDELANTIWNEMSRATERVESEQGGYWSYRCRLLIHLGQEQKKYGLKVFPILRKARKAYHSGEYSQSITLFESAAERARKEDRNDLAMELAYIGASVRLSRKQYESASRAFFALVKEFPESTQSANAHLLGCYALGQIYRDDPTAIHREDYTKSLEEHRTHFEKQSSWHEATWMLANLQESRLQRSKAIALYLQIDQEHPKFLVAQVAIARCYESQLTYLEQEKRLLPQHVSQARVQTLQRIELAKKVTSNSVNHSNSTSLSLPVAELKLRLARMSITFPPRDYKGAEDQLTPLVQIKNSNSTLNQESDFETTWKPLINEATRNYLVSLAGQHRTLEAEQIVESLSVSDTSTVLQVLKSLVEASSQQKPEVKRDLGFLQLKTAERLSERRSALTPQEQLWLDQLTAQAYLSTGQLQRGITSYRTLKKNFPQNNNFTGKLADLLMQSGTRPHLEEAKQLFKELESKHPKGSTNFLSARHSRIQSLLLLKETQAARKLLGVTKLLYPQPEDASLKQKFLQLESQLK